ncbi:hypothetical protein B0H14DRAFT_3591456 [Mycena olivaceomarginata]|nr:hypothetical protein B0H14DRAFT_3591456 [Mycena olivaceomarginata]
MFEPNGGSIRNSNGTDLEAFKDRPSQSAACPSRWLLVLGKGQTKSKRRKQEKHNAKVYKTTVSFIDGCQGASLGNGELSAKDGVDSHNTVGGGGSAKADTKRKATRQPVEDDEDSDDDYAPAKRAAPRKEASPKRRLLPRISTTAAKRLLEDKQVPATPFASTSASTAALLANPVDVIRAARERLEAQRLSAAAGVGSDEPSGFSWVLKLLDAGEGIQEEGRRWRRGREQEKASGGGKS